MLVSSTIDALLAIKTFDDNCIKTINIDDNGIYSLIQPVIPIYIEEVIKSPEDTFYIIPRTGDVLKEIQILGNFKTAELYQYDWTGSRRVIYDTINFNEGDETVMRPFGISGIPLICIGKTLYLDIIDGKDNTIVNCMFGFLPSVDRQKLMNFRNVNTDYGIKLKHQDDSIYQVIGMNDWSYSPNYMVKV